MSVTPENHRKIQVSYEPEIYEELPGRPPQATKNTLDDLLKPVVAEDKAHAPRWVRIGLYVNSTAATAAKNQLQQRHGRDATVEGWLFRTRRLPTGDTGLFVQYAPAAIVPGAKQKHEQQEKQRKVRIAKAREDRDREAKEQVPPGS
jgi:hypothetical protein